MSEVLDELERSEDPVERELARTLRVYQRSRASGGKTRSIGYEPRDIRAHGAVEVIERRIRSRAGGFDEVAPQDSYEAIVFQYPNRFAADVVEMARSRLGAEAELLSPTADQQELEQKTQRLLQRAQPPYPKGALHPQKVPVATTAYLRDPAVVAYVLRRASGRCEACGAEAPFKRATGDHYLEVHHLRPLADGGSDRVQNAAALCPNCHRAMHFASDAADRAANIYARVSGLVRE
nr:HNH endonuclease [Methylobacterium sp. ZNC0032]